MNRERKLLEEANQVLDSATETHMEALRQYKKAVKGSDEEKDDEMTAKPVKVGDAKDMAEAAAAGPDSAPRSAWADSSRAEGPGWPQEAWPQL